MFFSYEIEHSSPALFMLGVGRRGGGGTGGAGTLKNSVQEGYNRNGWEGSKQDKMGKKFATM